MKNQTQNKALTVGAVALAFVLLVTGLSMLGGPGKLRPTASANIIPEGVNTLAVYPTGEFPMDFGLVQGALEMAFQESLQNAADWTVKLKSTHLETGEKTSFNFGLQPEEEGYGAIVMNHAYGTITLTGDGVDANGYPKTVIEGGGGFSPLMDGYPIGAINVVSSEMLGMPYGAGKTVVNNLWLKQSKNDAITAFDYDGLEMTKNRVTDERYTTYPEEFFGLGVPVDGRFAISAFRAADPAPGEPFWELGTVPPPPARTGTTLIEDNVIDNTSVPIPFDPTDPHMQFDIGVATVVTNEPITIRNNNIHVFGTPIELSTSYGPKAVLDGNTLKTELSLFPGFIDGGLWAFAPLRSDHVTHPTLPGIVEVTNNNITMGSGEPVGSGMILSNSEETMLVSGNHVNAISGLAAIHMGNASFCAYAPDIPLQNAVVKNNTLTGSAYFALAAPDYPGALGLPDLFPFNNTTNGNEVLGNDMTEFQPFSGAHVLLEAYTYDNSLRGDFGDYLVDLNPLGPNADQPNHVTGFGSMAGAGGVGELMSETMPQVAGDTASVKGLVLNALKKGALKKAQEVFGQ